MQAALARETLRRDGCAVELDRVGAGRQPRHHRLGPPAPGYRPSSPRAPAFTSIRSVMTNPGSRLKQRIPRSPSSTARIPANRWNAPFDIAYAAPHPPSPAGACGSMTATADVTFTTVPSPRSSMPGSTALMSTICETTFAASLASSCSTVVSWKCDMSPGPVSMALFTSTSMRPQSSSARCTAATRVDRSWRSIGTGSARRPAASIACAVVSRLPGIGRPAPSELSTPSPSRMVRPVMTTSSPASASAMAACLPIPRLAPVTKATLGSGTD
jgi:hypothetical protein